MFHSCSSSVLLVSLMQMFGQLYVELLVSLMCIVSPSDKDSEGVDARTIRYIPSCIVDVMSDAVPSLTSCVYFAFAGIGDWNMARRITIRRSGKRCGKLSRYPPPQEFSYIGCLRHYVIFPISKYLYSLYSSFD